VPPPVVRRQQVTQHREQVGVASRAGLDHRQTRGGVWNPDVQEPVARAAPGEETLALGGDSPDRLGAAGVDLDFLTLHISTVGVVWWDAAMRTAFGLSFDVAPGYLNTASIGVPSTDVTAAVAEAVTRWSQGLDQPRQFDAAVATGRAMFARLVGVPAERVAIGSTVSQLVGLVAASIPAGARVLVARGEFTSVTFPFAARRGVEVTEADLSEIPGRAPDHDVVAVSVVQSSDGAIVDLDALRDAVAAGSTRVLLDATQATGWLPLQLDWADWVVGTSYKWLLSPRGASWLAVHPDAMAEMQPLGANWYAGENPWDAVYGLPLRLAKGARALDLSPSWFAHCGAAVAMTSLAELDLAEVRRHCAGLADELRAACGMPPTGSAIVAVEVPDAMRKLEAVGIRASERAGKARLAFHLYNTPEDVDRAADALRSGRTTT
jgi:selenocysteine lyase/cysteine desulfurase